MLFTINFVALMRLNTQLAFISIVVVPLIVITSIFFFRRVTKAYERYQEQEATLSTTLQENLTGVRVVKAFARHKYEIGKFDKDNWEKFVRGKRLLIMHSLFWPISDIICSFQILVGNLIAALMVINGSITIGTYLAYAGLVIWLIWPMRNLGRLIVQTSTGLVSYGRVMDVIKVDEEPLNEGSYSPTQDVKGDLVFANVSFEYDHGAAVLENISFHCSPGQVIALLGPTGSGKTTLLNVIAGVIPHYFPGELTGMVLINGKSSMGMSMAQNSIQVGLVMQDPEKPR